MGINPRGTGPPKIWNGGWVVFAGGGDMSWSLNFEVLHEMAYFVLMCCGHTTVSPSLTEPTNTTLNGGNINIDVSNYYVHL